MSTLQLHAAKDEHGQPFQCAETQWDTSLRHGKAVGFSVPAPGCQEPCYSSNGVLCFILVSWANATTAGPDDLKGLFQPGRLYGSTKPLFMEFIGICTWCFFPALLEGAWETGKTEEAICWKSAGKQTPSSLAPLIQSIWLTRQQAQSQPNTWPGSRQPGDDHFFPSDITLFFFFHEHGVWIGEREMWMSKSLCKQRVVQSICHVNQEAWCVCSEGKVKSLLLQFPAIPSAVLTLPPQQEWEDLGFELPLLSRCLSTNTSPLAVGAWSRHFSFSTLLLLNRWNDKPWICFSSQQGRNPAESQPVHQASFLLPLFSSFCSYFLLVFFFPTTSSRFQYCWHFWQNPWFWGGGKTCKRPTPYELKSASSATAGGCCTTATRHRAAGPHLGNSGSFLWKWEHCQVWSKM